MFGDRQRAIQGFQGQGVRSRRRQGEAHAEVPESVRHGLLSVAARLQGREPARVAQPLRTSKSPGKDLPAGTRHLLALAHAHAVAVATIVVEDVGNPQHRAFLRQPQPHVPVLGAFQAGVVSIPHGPRRAAVEERRNARIGREKGHRRQILSAMNALDGVVRADPRVPSYGHHRIRTRFQGRH